MILKPRSTTGNPRALLYKRYTSIEQSRIEMTAYKVSDGGVTTAWIFERDTLSFDEIPLAEAVKYANTVEILPDITILSFQGRYYCYSSAVKAWQELTAEQIAGATLESIGFNNVGKYQVNKYYFAGSFDYMVKGSEEGSTVQYVKGLITPLSSVNIRTFDDRLRYSPDDLVVMDGRLYAVENPEVVYKRMPKPFGIYFMTLNNIL